MLVEVKACGKPLYMIKCGNGGLKMNTESLKIKTWIVQKYRNVKLPTELSGLSFQYVPQL